MIEFIYMGKVGDYEKTFIVRKNITFFGANFICLGTNYAKCDYRYYTV